MKTSQKASSQTLKTEEHFRFDPEGHKYLIGKKRVPAVSDVLAKVGLSRNYKDVDPFYRDRGVACHRAIELYLRGNLDPTSLDPAIEKQFEAFLQFWESHKNELVLSLERPYCDRDLRFAGTPDLVTEKAIYDWKCSKDHDRVADLQGQAYKTLVGQYNEDKVGALPFIVVELHDDGSHAEFNYGLSRAQWPAVLDLYAWKTRGPYAD